MAASIERFWWKITISYTHKIMCVYTYVYTHKLCVYIHMYIHTDVCIQIVYNKTFFFVKSHFIETSTVPPVKISEELPAGRSAIGSRACKTCRVIMWALHYNICFDKWAVACKTYLGLSRGLTTKFLFRNFCQIKIQKSIIFKIKIARASPKHVFEKSCTIILNFCTTVSCIPRKRPQKCPKTSRWNRF